MLHSGQEFVGFMICVGVITALVSMLAFTIYSDRKLSWPFSIGGIVFGGVQMFAFLLLYWIGSYFYCDYYDHWYDRDIVDQASGRCIEVNLIVYGIWFGVLTLFALRKWFRERDKERFKARQLHEELEKDMAEMFGNGKYRESYRR